MSAGSLMNKMFPFQGTKNYSQGMIMIVMASMMVLEMRMMMVGMMMVMVMMTVMMVMMTTMVMMFLGGSDLGTPGSLFLRSQSSAHSPAPTVFSRLMILALMPPASNILLVH